MRCHSDLYDSSFLLALAPTPVIWSGVVCILESVGGRTKDIGTHCRWKRGIILVHDGDGSVS